MANETVLKDLIINGTLAGYFKTIASYGDSKKPAVVVACDREEKPFVGIESQHQRNAIIAAAKKAFTGSEAQASMNFHQDSTLFLTYPTPKDPQ